MVEKQLESSLWHLCIINVTIHFYSIMLIVKDIHYAKPLSEAIVFILVYLVICCILTFPSEYLILNKIEIFYDIISIYNSKNIFKRERESICHMTRQF